ncbi:MAG: hypothetical protein Q9220_002529 [cf. Caloplaca sp. 1 TL-2023]
MASSGSTSSISPAAIPNARQSDTSAANGKYYRPASEYPLDQVLKSQSNPLQSSNVPAQSPVTSSPFNLSPTALPFTPEKWQRRKSVPTRSGHVCTSNTSTPFRSRGAHHLANNPNKRLPPSIPRGSTSIHPARPTYENHVPGIPSHWIPLYGACHGMFYDPITKLFYGDESPRPTLERSDGSMQPIDSSTPLSGFQDHPEDALHILPLSVRDRILRRQKVPIKDSKLVHRYYCICQNAWLAQRHDCPNDIREVERSWDAVLPPMGFAPCLRPGDVVPRKEVTQDIKIGDLSYLMPAQRYAYENGLPMPVISDFDDRGEKKQA